MFNFLKSKYCEFRQSSQVAKAENIKICLQKVNFLLNYNPKNYFNEKSQELKKKNLYKKGYTFKKGFKLKNQILDLLGISFENKKSIFGFTLQRIESDTFSFWNIHKDVLRKHIPKNAKLTNNLDNRFGKVYLTKFV